MTTPKHPRRLTPADEIPVLDVDRLFLAPWEPGTKPDGTRDPVLPFWKAFLDAFRRSPRAVDEDEDEKR